ncbi:hypothetical protein LXA43DRAFT_500524 [Ganoderma leucocontextum]|nr:hypothetical protein LXA43DRAFT_500524 [Ganoderma leucocontextum]
MRVENPPKRPVESDAPMVLLRVRWNSRVAGFENGGVEELVEKARQHFRLGHVEEEFILTTSIAGEKVEVTDDVLKHVSGKSVLILEALPKCSHSDDGSDGTLSSGSNANTTVSRRPPTPPQPPAPPVTRTAGAAMNIFPRSQGVQVLRSPPGRPLMPRTVCRKPVIYLMPPKPLSNATVSVRLAAPWRFTHVYPLLKDPDHLSNGRQSVTWSVSARPDGSLVEKSSGLQLSYLFWEATAQRGVPPSPPPDPASHAADDADVVEHFDLANPMLAPDTPTAVLLPFADLLSYLVRVLKTLALHTTARNDFIAYWLPALSKHPYVALCFLPQRAVERAAELEAVPAPDAVTRVMMFFRGISASEVGMWTAARERVSEVDWASIVGVSAGAFDTTGFRVLEWEGMEVL